MPDPRNNAKYTPGPWRVVKQIEDCAFIVANTKIADVYSTVFRDLENEQANARLIASAPELLEVVTRMRQGYQNLMEFDLVSASTKNSLEVYIAEADRLIDKATIPPTPDRSAESNTPEAK